VEAASQVADPRVSRRKFAREIADFRRLAGSFRERGWFLAEAQFPIAVVVMAARNLKPSALVTGVRFDYSDYDFRPPSVRLIDPYTGVPYPAKEVPIVLRRRIGVQPIAIAGLPEGVPLPQVFQEQPLLQNYGPDEVPFVCLAGVREYHDHPGHSGDAWELHRSSGAGRLVRLLEIIDRYGTAPISGFNLSVDVKIIGYTQQSAPD
jgi:hypothetical protein